MSDFDFDRLDEPEDREMNYWQTKDGRKIAIEEMDDNHLENTIRMLDRKGIGSASKLNAIGTPRCDADIITSVEGTLANIPKFMIRKYRQLAAERLRRENAGTWTLKK